MRAQNFTNFDDLRKSKIIKTNEGLYWKSMPISKIDINEGFEGFEKIDEGYIPIEQFEYWQPARHFQLGISVHDQKLNR